MNADLFYKHTGAYWDRQLLAKKAVVSAEGDALLAAFRQHQAQDNFGAAAGQVSGSAVHGVNSACPAAPLTFAGRDVVKVSPPTVATGAAPKSNLGGSRPALTFPRAALTVADECALVIVQSYGATRGINSLQVVGAPEDIKNLVVNDDRLKKQPPSCEERIGPRDITDRLNLSNFGIHASQQRAV